MVKISRVMLASASIPGILPPVSIKVETGGEMYRIYLTALRDGRNFHLAYILDDFGANSKELFDRDYMNALDSLGYEAARSGQEWISAPPGFGSTSITRGSGNQPDRK
jgi:hypothetical protein